MNRIPVLSNRSKLLLFGSLKGLVMMKAKWFGFRNDCCVHGLLIAKESTMRHKRCYQSFETANGVFQTLPSTLKRRSSSSSSVLSSVRNISNNRFNSISLSIPTMEIMEEVGALVSILSEPSDVLFLDGDLGSGKTTFSRGFIKCKLGIQEEEEIRITSPTYLLSNAYVYKEDSGPETQRTREIHHMDLYRLSGTSSQDFDSLDLTRVYSDCISLIEWPIRLKPFTHLLPEESRLLEIDIRIPDPISDERTMSLISSSHSSWTKRLNDLVDEGMLDDLLLYDEDGDDDDDDDDII